MRGFPKRLLKIALGVVILGWEAWSFGALWFDCPVAAPGHPVAVAYLVTALVLLTLWATGRRLAAVAAVLLASLVTLWWGFLKPSNDRNWQPDVSREPWAKVNGDLVTLHNVRNFDYRPDNTTGESNPRWETRTVRISQLTGLDAFLNFWGVSWMAHPILSFQFKDGPPSPSRSRHARRRGRPIPRWGGSIVSMSWSTSSLMSAM